MKRVQTNIIFLNVNPDLMTVQEFCQRFRDVTEEEKDELGEDVCIMNFNSFGPGVCRLLTHVDISYEDTLLAIKKIKFVINEMEKRPTRKISTTNGHSINNRNGTHMNGSVGYQ